jgi:hypothetical protein
VISSDFFPAAHLHLGLGPDRTLNQTLRAAVIQGIPCFGRKETQGASTSECREKGQSNMADLGLWFYLVMGLVLVGLIGVFLYLRKKGDED